MATHDQLTIVSAYGHGDGAATIPSISKSMKELPGSRGLLLSPQKPANLPEHIEWKQIYWLDYRGYSTFMMHCLYSFIDTEFCLVVQDDGWVLDGNNWKEDYYNYDYIGGITHAGLVGNTMAVALYAASGSWRLATSTASRRCTQPRFMFGMRTSNCPACAVKSLKTWATSTRLTR